jgi:hypothetical protein
MDKIIDFSDVIHRPVLDLEQRFGGWIPPPSSGEERIQLGPIDRASPCLRAKSGFASRQT